MIDIRFNLKKTTQAACLLLRKSSGIMNYTKLIKLLYLADREALEKCERPITGDSYYSMNQGPILSRVLDFIKGNFWSDEDNYWIEHVEKKGFFLQMLRDPGDEELNKKEVEILENMSSRFKNYTYRELVNFCHRLPEWKYPNGSSIKIYLEDILIQIGKTEEEINSIRNEIETLNYTKEILGAQS